MWWGFSTGERPRAHLGDHAEALADFDAVLRLVPRHAVALCNRGWAEAELGRHEGALADFDAALQLEPSYSRAWGNRGWAKAELGRYEEAIADFDARAAPGPECFCFGS